MEDQQFLLFQFERFVSNAAAAIAFAERNPRDVMEMLEGGRRVNLNQALNLRSYLSVLERLRPDLAEDVCSARAILSRNPHPELGAGDESRKEILSQEH